MKTKILLTLTQNQNNMKRLFLVFTILFCITLANAQNPFEAYGYTPKIATLSNGKYNEFHDLDTIVQIGTVLFNTQSKQIVAFLQIDTLYSEATLQPDIVSMWMSPDPLASEYPSNSPYMYCLGNPIVFVDPDGRYVDWYKSKAGNVIWQSGSADKINVGGEDFRNIGTTYTKNQMGNNYHYVQDNLVGITNNNTSFGEYLQNDKAYKNAISVANTQSNQTVKDVYMARFNQGLSEAHAGTLQLMGSIIGAVLTVETAVSIYIGVEGLMAVGGSTIAKGSANLTKSQVKSISSLEKQIMKHETKLAEYIKNPMKYDNKGFLKNAPNDATRQKIIQSRINHLEKEISTFQNNIQKIINGN
jgi:hypothetical protein